MYDQCTRQMGYEEDSMSEAEIILRDTGVQIDENTYGKTAFDVIATEMLKNGYQIDHWITREEAVHTLYVYEMDSVPYVQGRGKGALLLDQELYDALVNNFEKITF